MAPLVSYTYSIPYLILLGVLLFFYANEQRYISFFSIRAARVLALFCLIFFFGFQCFVWNDWVAYYHFYEHLPNLPKLDYSDVEFCYLEIAGHELEVGFILYSSLIKSLGFDYFAWIFINSLIDLSVLYLIFKRYSPSIILSFVAFLLFEGISFEFNLFRNSKAILLFLLSLPYIEKRNFLKFFILNLIGIFFHTSSLLYIPCYWLLNCRVSLKGMWILFIISNLLFFLGSLFVTDSISNIVNLYFGQMGAATDKLSYHLTNQSQLRTSAVFSWIFLIRTALMVYVLLNYHHLMKRYAHSNLFVNSTLLWVVSANVFYPIGVLYVRIATLFVYAAWIMVVYCLFLNSGRVRTWLVVLFIIVAGAKISGETSKIMLIYRNVFWSDQDYWRNRQRWMEDYGRFRRAFERK